MPAFLVALISIATIGIFAPEVTGSIYGLVKSSFVKPGPDAFDVVELKGRGKGVVANRDIKVCEVRGFVGARLILWAGFAARRVVD